MRERYPILSRKKPITTVTIPTPLHEALKAYAAVKEMRMGEATEKLLRIGLSVEHSDFSRCARKDALPEGNLSSDDEDAD